MQKSFLTQLRIHEKAEGDNGDRKQIHGENVGIVEGGGSAPLDQPGKALVQPAVLCKAAEVLINGKHGDRRGGKEQRANHAVRKAAVGDQIARQRVAKREDHEADHRGQRILAALKGTRKRIKADE